MSNGTLCYWLLFRNVFIYRIYMPPILSRLKNWIEKKEIEKKRSIEESTSPISRLLYRKSSYSWVFQYIELLHEVQSTLFWQVNHCLKFQRASRSNVPPCLSRTDMDATLLFFQQFSPAKHLAKVWRMKNEALIEQNCKAICTRNYTGATGIFDFLHN